MRQSGVLNEIERTLFTRVSCRGGSTGAGARLSQAEAARRLSIAKGTLANWVVAVKGRQEKTVPGRRSVTELEGEDEGWLYLAGLKDVFTCEIVGYAMGERMTTGLVSQALFRAVQQKRPPAGLISRQYCAKAYRVLQA